MHTQQYIRVAVPVPLRQAFDFLPAQEGSLPLPGSRVRVPFGRRSLVGVVLAVVEQSSVPAERLKPIEVILDEQSVFTAELWRTLLWIADYYLAPIGEVLEAALPAPLRKGAELRPGAQLHWRITDHGRSASLDELHRAPLQLALIKRFSSSDTLHSEHFKDANTGWRQALRALVEKGWLEEFEQPPQLEATACVATPVRLNTEQQTVCDQLQAAWLSSGFHCALLHGVTGSGKTEVYFQLIQQVLDRQQQVLILVPEIGLTPQLIERINNRFHCGVVTLHSGLTDQERHLAWWHLRRGNAGIAVGTRSAVFVGLPKLGLIVVDEEHDASFKQQDGVRYHARDVAIYRAKQADIPILLGSATPSLESMHNASQGRYSLFHLTSRAGAATLPDMQLLDTRTLPVKDGLSPPLLEAITRGLEDKQQVMLFLNRRGYAPVLYCKDCGATSVCHRCDSHLTFHQRSQHLRCHHCGYEAPASGKCVDCGSENLAEVGEGTQRVEDALIKIYPQARLLRMDRDSTRRKGELETQLKQIADGEFDIILGTQLLSKGHDFAGVSTVGVLGADQGLYSTDFRARENLFQQLMQVAGRAGRRQQQGRVYIQTAFPMEPFFKYLCEHDYNGFAAAQLAERDAARFPPLTHFAVWRAESTHQSKALQFLRRLRQNLPEFEDVLIMDAIPAPMERKAGRYRAQLLVNGERRSLLHQSLRAGLALLEQDSDLKRLANSVRWSLDVDPIDLY